MLLRMIIYYCCTVIIERILFLVHSTAPCEGHVPCLFLGAD